MGGKKKGLAGRRIYPLFLAVSAAYGCWDHAASGQTYSWNTGSGTWSAATGGDWTPAGPPGNGATVDITNNDATSRIITYNYTGSVTLNSLTIDNSGTGTDSLSMSGNDISTGNETVGNSGKGVLNQSGGINTVSGVLVLGNNADSTGTYSLGGSGLLSASGTGGADEYVGYYGAGIFNQTGGTNSTPGYLLIGGAAGVSGQYTLGSGTLSVGGYEVLSGTFQFNGGSGPGAFNQTGGTSTLGNLTVGLFGAGTYTLSAGSLSVTGSESLGGDGGAAVGTFNQTGGTNAPGGDLYVGNGTPDDSGTYNLGGTGSLTVVGDEYVGGDNTGQGTFNQTSGTNTADKDLFVGDLANETNGGFGTYTLSGGILNVTDGLYVGGSSTAAGNQGDFQESSGSVTIDGTLKIWNSTGSSAALSGGTLTVGLLDTSGTPSLFTWTGGTLHLTNQELDFTSATDSNASFGNSLTLNSGQTLIVDNIEWLQGVGASITQNTGGNNTCQGLDIGNTAGSDAIYSLAGGSLTVSVEGEFVGNGFGGTGGEGYFAQTGGSNSTPGLYIGYGGSGVTGEYDLFSGASLTVSGDEYIGDYCQGIFDQYGGTHAITGNLYLSGVNSGVLGVLDLRTGTLGATNIYVGGSAPGQGVINLFNGTITANGTLDIANSAGSYVAQSGGTLTVGTLNTNSNPSSFQWTAGILQLTAQPLNFTGGSDVYASFGDSLTLGSAQTLIVDDWEWLYGNGASVAQNTGSSNTCEGLYIGNTSGGGIDAIYSMNGGTLTSTSIPEYVGYGFTGSGGEGDFYQYGGSNKTPELDVGYSSTGVTGIYNLYTGASLNVTGNEYIGVLSQGTFSQYGGTHTIGSNLYIGGSSSGDLGLFYLDGGSLGVANVYVGGSSAQGALTIGSAALMVSGTLNIANIRESDVFQAGGTVTTGNTVNNGTYYEALGVANLGPLSGAGTLVVGEIGQNGTLASMTVSALNQSFVTINTMGSLKITGGSDNIINTLTMNGGQLDITNTRLFIDYGSGPDPIASIEQWIANGFYGSSGPQIISSAIAADDAASGLSYGIGYADGADGVVAGLPSGEIEIMFTLLGDANLDGTVNAEDFTPFSANVGKDGSWDQGDFNYDGTINSEDFTPFSANLGKSATLAAQAGVLNSANAINLANVPEPASAGAMTVVVLGLFARRRRRINSRYSSAPGSQALAKLFQI